ncbi:MAG: hypothetical protein P1V34_16650 [Alphaproteobacteria bacterium]|nr:hypothetical protein [Alphaproteobacteria bacterium]
MSDDMKMKSAPTEADVMENVLRLSGRQHALPLTGGGSGSGYRALPLFQAANDAHAQERRHG